MNLRTLLAVNAALLGAVAAASGDTYSFLSTFPSNWVGYAGAPVPTLNTSSPGSIVDTPASGNSYGRLTTAFTAYPTPGAWRVGDSYAFNFDGVVSNNTAFRMEFNNGAAAVGSLLGFQFAIVNAGANNGDTIQINAFGGSTATLFNNANIGGAGGVGLPQRVIGNVTLSILNGTSANVSGSLADSLGNLWTGPSATITLGGVPASLFAGLNVNTGGGASGITTMNWAVTQVPEPSSILLFTGLGLVGLWFAGRLRQVR